MCPTTAPSTGCGSRAWAVPFERGVPVAAELSSELGGEMLTPPVEAELGRQSRDPILIRAGCAQWLTQARRRSRCPQRRVGTK